MTTESEGDYVLPSTASESGRLERQARLYGGAEFLNSFLTESPMQVLEIGSGTGYFTRHVADRLPGAKVFGIDADPARLAYARARSVDGNPTYEQAQLTDLPFESGEMDLAYCRFVLVHAPDPEAAIAELVRVVRTGGRIVTYEMVHHGIWFSPPKPAFARLLAEVIAVMRERGMEPDQGLHTGPALIRAGLDDVRVEVIPHRALAGEPLFEDYRENWLATFDGIGEALGERFDRGLIDRALAELRDERPDQLLVELAVLACGRVV